LVFFDAAKGRRTLREFELATDATAYTAPQALPKAPQAENGQYRTSTDQWIKRAHHRSFGFV
jgi:hypothetical protein